MKKSHPQTKGAWHGDCSWARAMGLKCPISKQLKPSKKPLLATVADSKSALRASLSGDMVEALTGFMEKAKSGGKIYAALYELHDEELIDRLKSFKNRLPL